MNQDSIYHTAFLFPEHVASETKLRNSLQPSTTTTDKKKNGVSLINCHWIQYGCYYRGDATRKVVIPFISTRQIASCGICNAKRQLRPELKVRHTIHTVICKQ